MLKKADDEQSKKYLEELDGELPLLLYFSSSCREQLPVQHEQIHEFFTLRAGPLNPEAVLGRRQAI